MRACQADARKASYRGQITRETNHLLPNVTCKKEGEYKKKKRGGHWYIMNVEHDG